MYIKIKKKEGKKNLEKKEQNTKEKEKIELILFPIHFPFVLFLSHFNDGPRSVRPFPSLEQQQQQQQQQQKERFIEIKIEKEREEEKEEKGPKRNRCCVAGCLICK